MLPENANKVACLLVEVAEHSQSAEGYRPRSGRMLLSADPIVVMGDVLSSPLGECHHQNTAGTRTQQRMR